MKQWMQPSKLLLVLLMALVALGAFACKDDEDKKSTDDDTDTPSTDAAGIEIFSWWTAPGEAEALQALIDVYQDEYPDVDVVNVVAEMSHGEDAREVLNARIADNDPPDVFQLGPRDIPFWVEYDGDESDNRLESLDALFDVESWDALFPQGVLDVLKHGGTYYAVPVNMHRQNTMFYNTGIVSENDVPGTLEEFYALAETLQADGIVPLAVSAGTGGWTLEIVLYSVMAASQGPEFQSDFYSGKLDMAQAANLTKLEAALDDYLQVMSYTNDDASDLGWDNAADLVYSGEAAMYIHGDWAKGYLMSKGWLPGVDFGAAASPGTSEAFIYNVDSFALCKNAPSRDNALDFLRVVGSADAQGAFNKIKGSTPVHPEADIAGWDSVALDTLDDLKSATVVHNVEVNQFSVPAAEAGGDPTGMADQLLAMYQDTLTREELIEWIVDNYSAATAKD